MVLMRACHLCGDEKAFLIVAPHCHNCESQIKKGLRKGTRVLRKDCPFRPGKKIWCRAFGNVHYVAKSRTCQSHCWAIIKRQVLKEMAQKLKNSRRLKQK